MPIPQEIHTGFKIEEEALWAITLPIEEISLSELENNLDIYYLESEGTDDWNMSPSMLIKNIHTEIQHREKVLAADMQYPIDIYFFKDQWIILDGVHRFTKAHLLGNTTIRVRRVPDSVVEQIKKSPEDYLRWQGKPISTFIEYTDDRLVRLYDTINPYAADTEFYIALAKNLSASSIIDIGCGTGILACELAQLGHHVVGIEPSEAMLKIARNRPYGEKVQWIQGDAQQLGGIGADLAIMTGHVAQVFLDEESWHNTLVKVHSALRTGGRIVFESRNPDIAPWRKWTPSQSRYTVYDNDLGEVIYWHKLLEVVNGRVHYETHYVFTDSSEQFISLNELRFRTRTELGQSLIRAGFVIENVYGNWNKEAAHSKSPELIFVAIKKS